MQSQPSIPSEDNAIALGGAWRFELDPSDSGMTSQWFLRDLQGTVILPGSLPDQGLGEEITAETEWTGTIFDRAFYDAPEYAPYRQRGNIKVPFFLQPETRFVGAAWYQRDLEIPHSWVGKRIELFLERPHWQTRVWIDGIEVGTCDSLSTPHEFLIDSGFSNGTHRLTIRVDNRLSVEVGENAHSVTDHTQGNWNGIVGRMELRAVTQNWIEDLQVYPDVPSRSVTVRGELGGACCDEAVDLQVKSREDGAEIATHSAEVEWNSEGGRFEARIELGKDALLWDEFNPALYELSATITGCKKVLLFGLREFSTQGTQFQINGRTTFLRGALDCAVFPLTGYPPTDVDSWRKILTTIKSCGLNHVRFHSWCPPEAAFVAGDELGIYFQVECAVWPNSVAVLAFNSPSGIGDGNAVDRWAYAEGERILKAYGNHPCFVMMACGNEPGGPHHREYLSAWVSHFRKLDDRCLYTGAAGWPEIPENEFHVIPDPRIHQWGDGLDCRLNGLPPATTHDYSEIIDKREVPIIAHEIGQWCSYPALGDAGKYEGHLKPRNHQIFSETLSAHHLSDQADDFLQASGKLQALCYKEEIESALRTRGMGGFQLLGLQDFPGQGTAPVGVLDAFWETKGYFQPSSMKRFCDATVPLARLKKRVFSTDENLEAEVEVSHFGAISLENAFTTWELKSEKGAVACSGTLATQSIPSGGLHSLGKILISLDGMIAAARYQLVVRITADGVSFENDWDIWIYPSALDLSIPSGVLAVDSVEEALVGLSMGHTVLLMPRSKDFKENVALGFSPIFWNTSCTQGQAPHTLGILCDPHHPLFADFPTEDHSNWQWWYLIQRSIAMVMDGLPPDFRPHVQVIDDWFTNRRLGLLFEAQVGSGRLIVCGVDLWDEWSPGDGDPVARQFLKSLLGYAAERHFSQTAHTLTESELTAFFDQTFVPNG